MGERFLTWCRGSVKSGRAASKAHVTCFATGIGAREMPCFRAKSAGSARARTTAATASPSSCHTRGTIKSHVRERLHTVRLDRVLLARLLQTLGTLLHARADSSCNKVRSAA